MLSVDMIIACFEWGGPFSLRSVDTAVWEVRRATWIEYDNSSVAKQNICLSHNTASCTRCTCWYNFWQRSHSWQEEGIQNRDITCGSRSVIGAVHTTGKYLELMFVGQFGWCHGEQTVLWKMLVCWACTEFDACRHKCFSIGTFGSSELNLLGVRSKLAMVLGCNQQLFHFFFLTMNQ